MNLYGFVGNDPIGFFDVNGEYTFREWLDIAGGFGEGWSDGAEIAWQSIRSPFEALGQTGGTLSTAYGRQQFAEMLQRLGPLVERLWRDECFRKQAIDELGDEFKAWLEGLQTVEGQSRLLSQGGTAAFLAAGSLTAKNAQWLQKLEQLARRLDRLTPDGSGGVARRELFSEIGGQGMDPAMFNRIKSAFERHPGRIMLEDKNSDLELDRLSKAGMRAEGYPFNENVIFLRLNPSTSSVFEELIHTAQLRRGMNRVTQWREMEVEAAQKCHFAGENRPRSCGSKPATPRCLSSYQFWFSDQALLLRGKPATGRAETG